MVKRVKGFVVEKLFSEQDFPLSELQQRLHLQWTSEETSLTVDFRGDFTWWSEIEPGNERDKVWGGTSLPSLKEGKLKKKM